MTVKTVYVSRYAASTSYEHLEKFAESLGKHPERYPGSLVKALCRIGHHQPAIAKRIFDFAAKEPFVRLLSKKWPNAKVPPKLSEQGLHWAEETESRFTQEPAWALCILEAVFLLECIEPWAEDLIGVFTHGRVTLEEFRGRELDVDRVAWIDTIYANARAEAHSRVREYVQERDHRIAIAMAALIDGVPLEGFEVLPDPKIEGFRLFHTNDVVSWVLCENNYGDDGIPF